MKNEIDYVSGLHPSPSFSKTARDWILSSALYDGIEDEDIRQIHTLLSEKGANPNVLLPEYGITPFHLVVANESTNFAVQATDICLQHGADPNVRSEDGLTPVHLAAMWGCPEVLQVLLASGGDPWLVDCFNKNAFHYAQSEGQHECYKILTRHCDPKRRPPGHSKAPYQLNLKRVVLYKNDLQIVYEASPSGTRKSACTQTPSFSRQSQVNPIEEVLSGFSEIRNISDEINQSEKSNVHESRKKKFTSLERKDREKIKDNTSVNGNSHEHLNSRLKEVIVRHRRNSAVFEYCPPKENKENSSSGIISWDDLGKSDVASFAVSELVDRLEKTNIFRQSLKPMGGHNDVLRNITQRKKPCILVKPEASVVTEQSTSSYQSCQKINSRNSIGFVFDHSKNTDCSTLSSCKEKLESPPSIGFVLDNLDRTSSRIRGSSLFSDIASDVEVYSTPGRETGSSREVMTEDDTSAEEKPSTKLSSSDSLYPYVSCVEVSTKESETSECFESCEEIVSRTSEGCSSLEQQTEGGYEQSGPQEVNSVIDSILNNIDEDKKTPVNPRLITSTPERLACGDDRTNFSSDSEKQRWVEAKVLSSDEEQCLSISEEYEYTDMDEGVVLIEKRYLMNDISVSTSSKGSKKSNMPSSTSESEVSTATGSDAAYDTDDLRRALRDHGFTPGPINGNTKRVYLRKLKRCKRHPPLPPPVGFPAYSPELLKTLDASCEHLLLEWGHLEDSMSASFSCSRRPWREGQAKTSFTYLLLDPRLAHDLPACATTVQHVKLWPTFLQSIFYVGKGKRARPYAHLYQAVASWQKQEGTNSKKIQRILDIWQAGLGVVCLHVFHNIIPVEALTREAAMISALTLPQLTNEKAGEFYGSAGCWNLRLKRRLGCVLLHRAFKVFLAEGERQLRPADID
ncbi:uncharacterized protein LOC124355029 isoform X2 [Homalodisca vitripennis]|uniref:uncharacterized protein LOC124355029 isoform X2 n=1 Tax=Homalodisca vitripennis TaxID=197043 RepID=UPI001EEB7B87|nr:uncharacterized protein LOC124355029 isoform X2 [Homalodisca vitripennis]